jgi:hypothetical protein
VNYSFGQAGSGIGQRFCSAKNSKTASALHWLWHTPGMTVRHISFGRALVEVALIDGLNITSIETHQIVRPILDFQGGVDGIVLPPDLLAQISDDFVGTGNYELRHRFA